MKSPQATILGQISKMGSANDIDTHSNSQKLNYSGEGMHIHNICTLENYIYISQQKPRQWSAYGQSAYVQSPYVQSAQEDRDSVQAGKGHMDVSAYMYLLLVGERFLHIAVNAPRVKSHTLYIYAPCFATLAQVDSLGGGGAYMWVLTFYLAHPAL